MKPAIQRKLRLESFKIIKVNYSNDNMKESHSLGDLKININLHSEFSEEKKNSFFLLFNVELRGVQNSFELKILSKSTFVSEENYPQGFKNSDFVLINAPAIVFPFIRSFINTFTSTSGIGQVILPSINFAKTFKRNQEK